MRYLFALSAILGILFLFGFGSFAMAAMDHADTCPVALANGLSCIDAIGITNHLNAIQEVLQGVIPSLTMSILLVSMLMAFGSLQAPAPANQPYPLTTHARTDTITAARRPLVSWHARLTHSPTAA